MPRINGINFYQNRSKIKLFLPKKGFFRVLVDPTPIHYASGGWGLAPRPQLPPVVGHPPPNPATPPPIANF